MYFVVLNKIVLIEVRYCFKREKGSGMNPIIKGLLLAVIISLSNDFILESMYSFFANHHSYLAMTHNQSHYFKYCFIVIIFAFVFLRYGSIEGIGKFVLWLAILAGIGGALASICWYDAASQKGIIQQRLWGKTEYTWDQLKQVTTKGEIEYIDEKKKRAKFEYMLHFTDNVSINMWTENTLQLSELDKFLNAKQIMITHQYVNHIIQEKLKDYIDGDVDSAKQVLGIYEF